MFKNVFAKYVTAFMTIITLGFALLLIIVTSILSNFSVQTKNDMMDNATQVTRVWLETALSDDETATFESLVVSEGEDPFSDLMNIFADGQDEMTVLFADPSGLILSSRGKNAGTDGSVGKVLPAAIMETVTAGETYREVEHLGFLQQRVVIHAIGVYDESGTLCGIAAVYSVNLRWGNMVEQISDAVMTAALLVLLASLIAAYFISERITGPMREMSSAAKKFAAGQFDVRVRVRGRDEVADLAIAFNEMAASLENLEKMRSSFIANVSHDLRTPMTTIAGFIDGIRDGVIPKSEQEHYLEVISVEVRRLSRLVSSLLDLSRIQAGDRKFVMKPFDICEMARIILISFEQKIEEKHLDVAFECEEDRILVNADHDAIYQVFYNICHNAVKFSRDGAAFRIRISLNREKKVQVAVYNEGQGISGEDLPLIFERFYKSDKSRGLDKSGIGLGLFISKTIMTAHGERIWVTSEEGSNCEFFFTLPRASHAHHSEDQS